MGLLLRLALLGLAALHAAQSAAGEPTVLTEGSFDQSTQQGTWLVKFYAPWCGHCKKLAPKYDKVSTDPRLKGTDVRVAKVDCTAERSVCERLSVGSYPTLKVVAGGKYYDYAGARDVDSMVSFALDGYKTMYAERILSLEEFVKQRNQVAAEQEENERKSAVVAITSVSFEELVKEGGGSWLIKFYAPWCGHCKRLAPTWHKLSRSLQESGSTTRIAKVDCTVHRRVCSRFGVNGYPTLYYVNNGQVYKYQGGRTLPAFLDYVNGGWEKAELVGPIPEEGFLSAIVDSVIEWAAENTFMAVGVAILAIAIMVAVLVALLDYCLGADDTAAFKVQRVEQTKSKKEAKKEAKGEAKQADGKPKTE